MSGERKVLWSGRFAAGADPSVLDFTSSLSVDRRLAAYDVLGSLAHVKMLGRQGVLPAKDVKEIEAGLKRLMAKARDGTLPIDASLEDVHSNMEYLLTEDVKDAGARLHTGRSRNDQVATDARMYARDAALDLLEAVTDLQAALMERASASAVVILPGFTHVQHAQPVTLAHHLMAHLFRFARDAERLQGSFGRVNVCPLGSAALAGTTYPIDRGLTAKLLAFDEPCANSMDGVSDRDFVAEHLFIASLCAVHLSSLCEELVYWSSPEFGFIEMADAYSTGSSIMPQKKNPDVAELIRGRTGATMGDLMGVLVTMKSLPLTYNRDLQEDKAALFSAQDRLLSCLVMAAGMVRTMSVREDRMMAATADGFLNATDLADYLVTKGLPFRRAHEVVGAMVRQCVDSGRRLDDMGLDEMRSFSGLFDEDVMGVIPIERCVARRKSLGGTSPEALPAQMARAEASIKCGRAFAERERDRIGRAYDALLA